MKSNPINILEDQMQKIGRIMALAFRVKLTVRKSKKLQAIDLRKYRGRPEKKKQIRKMIRNLYCRAFFLMNEMLINQSQPVPRFEKGGSAIVSESGNEVIAKINLKDQ